MASYPPNNGSSSGPVYQSGGNGAGVVVGVLIAIVVALIVLWVVLGNASPISGGRSTSQPQSAPATSQPTVTVKQPPSAAPVTGSQSGTSQPSSKASPASTQPSR